MRCGGMVKASAVEEDELAAGRVRAAEPGRAAARMAARLEPPAGGTLRRGRAKWGEVAGMMARGS